MEFQRTIRRPITIAGVGLHSGKDARVTLKPGRPNQGIVFLRTDLADSPLIPADHRNVVNTQLATTLGIGKVTISTVEHVLAALAGLNIDNCVIEVDGPEIPILDGSSARFCEAIEKVGVETQLWTRPVVALRRRVEVRISDASGDKWAAVEPSSTFEVYASIDWNHSKIGYQEFHYRQGKTSFTKELSKARTFGFLKEVEMLQKMGLARGGSLENAIVLDDERVLNPDGLRYADEFVRHKALDALGDFKLAGVAFRGYFRLHKAGHDLHCQLLTAIFSDPNNYELLPSVQESELARPVAMRLTAAAAY